MIFGVIGARVEVNVDENGESIGRELLLQEVDPESHFYCGVAAAK